MLALGTCCGISMRMTSALQDTTTSRGRNMGNDILNHIGYGHMGVTAMILGLFVLLRIGNVRKPWYLRLLAAATVCLGAFTILAAASRGALVAAIVLIPVVMYLGLRRGSRSLTLGICIVLGFVLTATAAYLSRNGADIGRSLGSISAYSAANNSVWARQNLYRDAWHDYLQHPWLGSSIVEKNSLFYPHNAIIEAFMATGTFGGTAFVLLILIAISRAIRLALRDPAMAWVPICFFQHLIGVMFSGGIWGNTVMWGMTAIVLGVEMPEQHLVRNVFLPQEKSRDEKHTYYDSAIQSS